MKLLTLLLFTFSLSVDASEKCPLEGYWKFDKNQTLDSLSKLKGNTATPRNILTRENFSELYIYYD